MLQKVFLKLTRARRFRLGMIVLCTIGAIVLVAVGSSSLLALGTVTMEVDPPTQAVPVNSTLRVDIVAETGTEMAPNGLGGYGFDLKYDPQLRVREWQARVPLAPLCYADVVAPLLKQWDVDPAALSEDMCTLLSVPQHLRLFHRLAGDGKTPDLVSPFQLYERFIDEAVARHSGLGDPTLRELEDLAASGIHQRRQTFPRAAPEPHECGGQDGHPASVPRHLRRTGRRPGLASSSRRERPPLVSRRPMERHLERKRSSDGCRYQGSLRRRVEGRAGARPVGDRSHDRGADR